MIKASKPKMSDEVRPIFYSQWSDDCGPIYLVDNEGLAIELNSRGLPATAFIGAAQNWKSEYSIYFSRKKVILLSEDRIQGLRFANKAYRELSKVATSVRVILISELINNADAVSYLKTFGTLEAFISKVNSGEDDMHRLQQELLKRGEGRLNFYSAAEILSSKIPPTDWLWEGVLPAGGVSAIVGKPKMGKTTFAKFLASRMITGEGIFGRATKKCSALLILLEEVESELKVTLTKLGVAPEAPMHFHICSQVSDGLSELESVIDDLSPGIVIIDPIFQFIEVKDTNDYPEISKRIRSLVLIARKSGAHIMILHHQNKNGVEANGVLGSTGFFGALDTLILLGREKDRVTLSSKQRFGEPFDPAIYLNFDQNTASFKVGGDQATSTDIEIRDNILGLFVCDEPITYRDIKENVTGKASSIGAILNDLVSKGTLVKEKGSRGAFSFRLAVPNSPPYKGGNGNDFETQGSGVAQ